MAAPVRIAAMVESIVGGKSSLRLRALLAAGPQRPSALQRACPGPSAKARNERRRKFQRLGLVVRRGASEGPPIEVDCSLSPLGRRLLGLLAEVDRLQQALEQGDVPSA